MDIQGTNGDIVAANDLERRAREEASRQLEELRAKERERIEITPLELPSASGAEEFRAAVRERAKQLESLPDEQFEDAVMQGVERSPEVEESVRGDELSWRVYNQEAKRGELERYRAANKQAVSSGMPSQLKRTGDMREDLENRALATINQYDSTPEELERIRREVSRFAMAVERTDDFKRRPAEEKRQFVSWNVELSSLLSKMAQVRRDTPDNLTAMEEIERAAKRWQYGHAAAFLGLATVFTPNDEELAAKRTALRDLMNGPELIASKAARDEWGWNRVLAVGTEGTLSMLESIGSAKAGQLLFEAAAVGKGVDVASKAFMAAGEAGFKFGWIVPFGFQAGGTKFGEVYDQLAVSRPEMSPTERYFRAAGAGSMAAAVEVGTEYLGATWGMGRSLLGRNVSRMPFGSHLRRLFVNDAAKKLAIKGVDEMLAQRIGRIAAGGLWSFLEEWGEEVASDIGGDIVDQVWLGDSEWAQAYRRMGLQGVGAHIAHSMADNAIGVATTLLMGAYAESRWQRTGGVRDWFANPMAAASDAGINDERAALYTARGIQMMMNGERQFAYRLRERLDGMGEYGKRGAMLLAELGQYKCGLAEFVQAATDSNFSKTRKGHIDVNVSEVQGDVFGGGWKGYFMTLADGDDIVAVAQVDGAEQAAFIQEIAFSRATRKLTQYLRQAQVKGEQLFAYRRKDGGWGMRTLDGQLRYDSNERDANAAAVAAALLDGVEPLPDFQKTFETPAEPDKKEVEETVDVPLLRNIPLEEARKNRDRANPSVNEAREAGDERERQRVQARVDELTEISKTRKLTDEEVDELAANQDYLEELRQPLSPERSDAQFEEVLAREEPVPEEGDQDAWRRCGLNCLASVLEDRNATEEDKAAALENIGAKAEEFAKTDDSGFAAYAADRLDELRKAVADKDAKRAAAIVRSLQDAKWRTEARRKLEAPSDLTDEQRRKVSLQSRILDALGVAHRVVDRDEAVAEGMAEESGRPIAHGKTNVGGEKSRDYGVLKINPYTGQDIMKTTGHELLHYLRRVAPDIYAKVVGVFEQFVERNGKARKAYEDLKAKNEERYRKLAAERYGDDQEKIDDYIREEVMSDLNGELWQDEGFLLSLAAAVEEKNKGFGARFLGAVREMVDTVLRLLKGDASSEAKKYFYQYEKVRDAVAAATAELSKRTTETKELAATLKDLVENGPQYVERGLARTEQRDREAEKAEGQARAKEMSEGLKAEQARQEQAEASAEAAEAEARAETYEPLAQEAEAEKRERRAAEVSEGMAKEEARQERNEQSSEEAETEARAEEAERNAAEVERKRQEWLAAIEERDRRVKEAEASREVTRKIVGIARRLGDFGERSGAYADQEFLKANQDLENQLEAAAREGNFGRVRELSRQMAKQIRRWQRKNGRQEKAEDIRLSQADDGLSERGRKEYEDVVRRYQGTPMWMKAPNGKPTNLTERQWVQARTPAFKEWGGEWEAYAANRNLRRPNSVSQAAELVKSAGILNKPLHNYRLGITATVSGGALSKMESEKATKQSASPRLHALAVANVDSLFRSAFDEIVHSDSHNRKEVTQTHRLGSLLLDPNTDSFVPVMLTVLEYRKDGTKIYSIEAVDIQKKENSAGQLAAVAKGERQAPIAEFINTITQYAKKVNSEGATKIVDENGDPLVVYHDTNSTRFVNRETGEDWDLLSPEEREKWDNRDDWEDYWEERDFYAFDRRRARQSVEMPAFFFTPNADPHHEYGKRRIAVFLNIRNPAMDPPIPNRGVTDTAGRDAMEDLKAKGYDGFIRHGEDGRIVEIAAFEPNQIKSATENVGDFGNEEEDFRFSRASEAEAKEFESKPHITTYRSFLLIDGKLYPPMASQEKGENGRYRLDYGASLGEVLKADERPENAFWNGKAWKYKLKKEPGSKITDIDANYNPYWHSSDSMLNDQFSASYKRPRLVTVQCEIAEEESLPGENLDHLAELKKAREDYDGGLYWAEKANNSVGLHNWHSGEVASDLPNGRHVYLTRYLKPVRIVPDSEVAEHIIGELGQNLNRKGEYKFQVFPPNLRRELEARGMRFVQEETADERYSAADNRPLDAPPQSETLEAFREIGVKPTDALFASNNLNLVEGPGGSEASIRYSVSSGARGVGIDVEVNEQTGNVTLYHPGTRRAITAEDKLRPEEILDADDTTFSRLMKEWARKVGDLTGAKGEAWRKERRALAQHYCDILNQAVAYAARTTDGLAALEAVWKWAASSTFRSVKPNGDVQYSLSLDMTTICKKTEQLLLAVSAFQRKHARGCSPGEMLRLYLQTGKDGYQTPCPFCYVFSHWIRAGLLLESAWEAQNHYRSLVGEDGKSVLKEVEDWKAMTPEERKKNLDWWKKELASERKWLEENKSQINAAKTLLDESFEAIDLLSQLVVRERNKLVRRQGESDKDFEARKDSYNEAAVAEAEAKIAEITPMIDGAYRIVAKSDRAGWIKSTVVSRSNQAEPYMDFRFVPKDVLFSFERADELVSGYPAMARFRVSKGSAGGKAIEVDADNPVGDVVSLLGSGGRGVNVFEEPRPPMDFAERPVLPEGLKDKAKRAEILAQQKLYDQQAKAVKAWEDRAQRAFDNACLFAERQKLIGGNRVFSWSDSLVKFGPDMFWNFMQLQMIGASVQSYTKQLEGAELIAAMGGYVNGSLVANGAGFEPAKKGDKDAVEYNGGWWKLVFSNVQGINAEELFKLNQQYDKAGNILVGMSEDHIRIALRDKRIFFVIPWHASGMPRAALESMMRMLREPADPKHPAQDHTEVQSDARLVPPQKPKRRSGETRAEYEDRVNEYRERLEDWKQTKAEDRKPLGEFWRNECRFDSPVTVEGREFEPPTCYKEIETGDTEPSKDQNQYWDLRERMLRGQYRPGDLAKIRKDSYLSQIYGKLQRAANNLPASARENPKMVEPANGTIIMRTADVTAVYPYEYWDETSTFETQDVNGRRYLEYCRRLGVVPKFCGFNRKGTLVTRKDADGNSVVFGDYHRDSGYPKLLIDRRMYGLDGKYQDTTTVDATGMRMEMITPEGIAERWKRKNAKGKDVSLVTRSASAEAAETIAGEVSGDLTSRGMMPNMEATDSRDELLEGAFEKRDQVRKALRDAKKRQEEEDVRMSVADVNEMLQNGRDFLRAEFSFGKNRGGTQPFVNEAMWRAKAKTDAQMERVFLLIDDVNGISERLKKESYGDSVLRSMDEYIKGQPLSAKTQRLMATDRRVAQLVADVARGRDMIDALTQRMLSEMGDVLPEGMLITMDRNIGTYTLRAYQKFANPDYKPTEQAVRRATAAVRQELLDRFAVLENRVNNRRYSDPGERADMLSYLATRNDVFLLGKDLKFQRAARMFARVIDEAIETSNNAFRSQLDVNSTGTANLRFPVDRVRLAKTAQGVVDYLLTKDTAADDKVGSGASNRWKIQRDSFIRRKDLPDWLRELYGEITDFAAVMQSTLTRGVRVLGANEMFRDMLAENDKLPVDDKRRVFFSNAFDKPPQASHRIEGFGYGVLNGMYTDQNTARMLRDYYGMADQVPAAWRRGLSLARAMKTVYNLPTHARNLLGNIVFVANDGQLANPYYPFAWARAAKVLSGKSDAAAKERIRLIELGVIGGGAHGEDFRRTMEEAFGVQRKFADWPGADFLNWMIQKPGKLLEKMYAFEDNVFRAASFYAWTKAGKTDAEAVENVRNVYPTYEQAPVILDQMRKFNPLGPDFLTFKAESIRCYAEAIKSAVDAFKRGDLKEGFMRAGGVMLSTMAAAGLLSRSVGALIGKLFSDDDDDEMLTSEELDAMRLLLPSYRQDNLVWPWRDGKKLRYIDMGYVYPLEQLPKLWNVLTADGRSGTDRAKALLEYVFEGYVAGNMGSDLVMDLMRNRTDTGRKIWNEYDTPPEQVAKMTAHLLSALAPSSAVFGARALKILAADEDYLVNGDGTVVTAKTEAAKMLQPVRVYEMDLGVAYERRMKGYAAQVRDLKAEANIQMRRVRAHQAPKATGDKAVQTTREKLADSALIDMIHSTDEAGKTLGLPRSQRMQLLKEAGFTIDETDRILSGKPLTFTPSNK